MSAVLGVLMLAALTATGCGNGEDAPGRIDLDLAGGIPRGDISEAWLEFSGLTVERRDGMRVQHAFDQPRRIDLVPLDEGNAIGLAEDLELPSGRYEWIQLHLNTRGKEDTYLVLADDSVRELVVPSEGRHHLRVETSFEIPAGGEVKRTIDFHLHEPLGRKGPASNTYALRPILRSVDTATATHIRATAEPDFIARHCSEPHRSGLALYVFAGEGAMPDDIGGPGANPVSVSTVRTEEDDSLLTFHAAFLAPGDYTIALTCNAEGDTADTDDAFAFFGTTGVHTDPGDTVDHRFGAVGRP
jgi:hypothetical protein